MSVWLLIVLSGQLTRVPCAMGPSPSVDNAVSYTSLLRLIKNRQIDVTSMVELYLTFTRTHTKACLCAGIAMKHGNQFNLFTYKRNERTVLSVVKNIL